MKVLNKKALYKVFQIFIISHCRYLQIFDGQVVFSMTGKTSLKIYYTHGEADTYCKKDTQKSLCKIPVESNPNLVQGSAGESSFHGLSDHIPHFPLHPSLSLGNDSRKLTGGEECQAPYPDTKVCGASSDTHKETECWFLSFFFSFSTIESISQFQSVS